MVFIQTGPARPTEVRPACPTRPLNPRAPSGDPKSMDYGGAEKKMGILLPWTCMILHEFNTPGPWEAPGPRRTIKKYSDHKNMDYGGPEKKMGIILP